MKCAATEVENDVEKNCIKVEKMDPLVDTYQEIYANDLERRLIIKNDKLPAALSILTLLNQMCGGKPLIVGSGL